MIVIQPWRLFHEHRYRPAHRELTLASSTRDIVSSKVEYLKYI